MPEMSAYYQVVATRRSSLDEVEVNVEVAEHVLREIGLFDTLTEDLVQAHECLQRLKSAFAKKIKDNIGLSMRVNLLGCGQLPRSEGGKLSRVKDLRDLR